MNHLNGMVLILINLAITAIVNIIISNLAGINVCNRFDVAFRFKVV